MTALTLNTTVSTGRGFAGLDRIFAGLARWNKNRQTRHALSKLTTRELADIGLVKSDIDRLF